MGFRLARSIGCASQKLLQKRIGKEYLLPMHKFYLILIMILAWISQPAYSQEGNLTLQEESELQSALNRGLDLRRYDQAAWHTTDTMRIDVPDLANSGIKGWVVTEVENGLHVAFWRATQNGFAGVYSAVWNGSEVKHRQLLVNSDAILTEQQIALIEARETVDFNTVERCNSSPFNTVILPPEQEGDPTLVYLLTPQTSHSSIPLGGHYRFAVKGGKILEKRAFTKSCYEMPLHDTKDETNKPEAFVFTHLLDPVPTEIHVFSVFAASLPIYVSTTSNDYLWAVEVSGGQPRIRKLK